MGGKAKKNRKGEWVMKSGTDYWWDYCSPSKTRTRYNIACTSDCASDGEKYFWCYTGGSKWDYCSPEPSSTEEITSKGGWTCNGVCSKMASSYNFCEIRGKASFFEKSWWDFCTVFIYVYTQEVNEPIQQIHEAMMHFIIDAGQVKIHLTSERRPGGSCTNGGLGGEQGSRLAEKAFSGCCAGAASFPPKTQGALDSIDQASFQGLS